ncbi:transposase [Nitrosomonas sp. wSCUT-2]
MILKQLENLSGESIVLQWKRNPYYQAFCGIREIQQKLPCHSTELVHFRKHIDAEGVERIFRMSVGLHEESALELPEILCIMLRFRAGKQPSKPYAIAATAANVKSMELRSFCPERYPRKIPGTRKARSENNAGGVPRLNPLSAT